MYAENPSYFNTPQTTFGIRRTGPVHTKPMDAPIQRQHQLGTLSVDGRIIPAPVHSALSGIHMGSANGEGDDKGMAPWMTYSLYGGGGIALGIVAYFAYQKFMG